MIKRVSLIFFMLSLILPINKIYSSFSDQALFQIGKSRITIRWESDNEELGDLNNFYNVIALVANNYETIKKQNRTVFLECFKEHNSNYILYDDTYKNAKILRNFKELEKTIEEKLINDFGLKNYTLDYFDIFLISVPIYEINGNRIYPGYDEYLEFYYGATPGNMQIVEGKQLYYQYFFFKENSITEILKREDTSKAILVKKRISRKNINQLRSIY